MILHYDTQKVKDLYANKFIRFNKRCFNSLEGFNKIYKITCHIYVLAIQCIRGVFGTVVFQGYSTIEVQRNQVPLKLPVPVRSTGCSPDHRKREINFEYFSNLLPNFVQDVRVHLL